MKGPNLNIVEFSKNEFHNMWLFLKDAFFHPASNSVYVNKEEIDTVIPDVPTMSPLEQSLKETFHQFINIYCSDHILKQCNSFLMEGRVWRLFDQMMHKIEKDVPMNNVEFLQNNLFQKELEYVGLRLASVKLSDDPTPPDKVFHYGVPFYVSNHERLLIVKNYLEERIKGFTE